MTGTRIPKAELTGIRGALVTRLSKRMFGEVPEPVAVTWHNRRVLDLSMAIGRRAQKLDGCDPNLKSFATLAVASRVGCGFCLDFGYVEAHHRGLDIAKAREVPRWRESDVFTDLERDVLEYAEAMSTTPTTVNDALSARLLDALGSSALVELTMYIALEHMATRFNTALGVQSQEFAASCDLPPRAVPSTT